VQKSKSQTHVGNRLLFALEGKEIELFRDKLEPVELVYRDVLVEDEAPLDYVYFPNSGVVSVIAVYSNGGTAELATIGREGTTGFQDMLGASVSDVRLLVQIAGSAFRMRRAEFQQAVRTLSGFRELMDLNLRVFLHQVMISGACNATHQVKERLARWLLMMGDRTDGDVLPITQDLIAEMLGVYRPTASKALGSLQYDGVINVNRGRIEIVDRAGLTRCACECYPLVRARTARLLPKTYNVI